MHLFAYVGSGGALENAADIFLSILGALVGALTGLFLSLWLGAKVVHSTITPYYMDPAGENRSNHHVFKDKNVGIFADLLGIFDLYAA